MGCTLQQFFQEIHHVCSGNQPRVCLKLPRFSERRCYSQIPQAPWLGRGVPPMFDDSRGFPLTSQWLSQFWLVGQYTHPVLKNDGVKVNWDDDMTPIFLGKCQIDGNQSPPTSYHWQYIIVFPYPIPVRGYFSPKIFPDVACLSPRGNPLPPGDPANICRGAEVHDLASLQCRKDLGFPEEGFPISLGRLGEICNTFQGLEYFHGSMKHIITADFCGTNWWVELELCCNIHGFFMGIRWWY